MNQILMDIWGAVWPIMASAVAILGPIIVAGLAYKIKVFFDMKEDVEAKTSIHASAANGLRAAWAERDQVWTPGDASGAAAVSKALTKEVVDDAVSYVTKKNPDAVARFDLGPASIRDIVMAKVPEVVNGATPAQAAPK